MEVAIIDGSLIKNFGISTTSVILEAFGMIFVVFFFLLLSFRPIERSRENLNSFY